jgi:hypothetical protein
MNAIGGYFGAEQLKGESHFHTTPYRFDCGRTALTVILQTVAAAWVNSA